MEETLMWRSGDAFLPNVVRSILYKVLFKWKLVEINGWSLMHLFSGLVLSLVLTTNIAVGLLLHSMWEGWQIYIGMTNLTDPAEWTDIIMDTSFFLCGVLAIRTIRNFWV